LLSIFLFTGIISDTARSQVFSKIPVGYTEYMGWFPGDSVIWVSDDSGKYYYYDYERGPKLVWGNGKVTKLPRGVVRINGEYACKTSDLQHISTGRRFSASCTPNGWERN